MSREPRHKNEMTEADTCREFVTPKLVNAGWAAAPCFIGEQHSFTNGSIIVAGGKVRRGRQERADYLLYFRRDCPLRGQSTWSTG
jgi:type I restriction enzyme R subunit